MEQNSLSSIDGTWVGDGSNGNLSVALPNLSIASLKKGSPFNVMLDDSVAAATNNFFFEAEVTKLDGNISVGVVKKDEFLPGYKIKGMFYNGNVTNGSAALIVGFGEYVKEGSTIGVAVSHEPSGVLTTVFYLDGCCLGSAFRLEGIQAGDIYRPCLHVSGEATIKYMVPDSFPQATERQAPQHLDVYVGDWKLEKLLVGPELGEFPLPSNHDILLTLRQGSGDKTYDISVKVANSMTSHVVVKGKDGPFDLIQVGPARATMMMPPPELQRLEQLVAESLPKLYKMVASESLIMTGADLELSAGRYMKTFIPLTKYH